MMKLEEKSVLFLLGHELLLACGIFWSCHTSMGTPAAFFFQPWEKNQDTNCHFGKSLSLERGRRRVCNAIYSLRRFYLLRLFVPFVFNFLHPFLSFSGMNKIQHLPPTLDAVIKSRNQSKKERKLSRYYIICCSKR